MDDRPICTDPDCDHPCWGDEAKCRRHLIFDEQAPMFSPAAITPTSTDDGIEFFHPNPAPAVNESE